MSQLMNLFKAAGVSTKALANLTGTGKTKKDGKPRSASRLEMGRDLPPTKLYVDNQGAIELSKDAKSCQRSRHIERRYLKVRELAAEEELVVIYVQTDANPADVLTKPLDRATFERHTSTLFGSASTSQRGGC